MDLRQIRYFVAVARERNFTRAAEQLHIAQPPLSRQIQLLEEELGVVLLSRESRPLRLTDAGRVFYEQALQVLGRVDQMKTATRRVGLNERAVLSIGFVASTLYGALPLLLRKLREHAPELDVQLVELMTMQQADALKAGRIDIGFGRLRSNEPSLQRIVLEEERLVLAVAPDHFLASSDEPIELAAVARLERLIVYPSQPRPSFADEVLNLLNDQGVRPADIQEVRELQAALGLVSAGVGACVVPTSARLRSDVHYRPISDPQATSPVILSHRLNDDSKYVALVKRLVADGEAGTSP